MKPLSSPDNKADITIVVPVYNRVELVTRTLDSIAAQTHRPLNLVVVDNGSTDGTYENVTRWADEHNRDGLQVSVTQEARRGAARARQTGFALVKTPWVMFFDSDDVMGPSHVARVVKVIRENPEAELVGWDIYSTSLDGKRIRPRFAERNVMVRHIFHVSLSTQRYAVRSTFLRRAGGWDTDLGGWDDWALGVKLLLDSPEIRKLKGEPTVMAYAQPDSITGKTFSARAGEWEKAIERCEVLCATRGRSDLQRWFTARRIMLAGRYHRERNKLGNKQMAALLTGEPSRLLRWAYRGIYIYAVTGLPGISTLSRMLLVVDR